MEILDLIRFSSSIHQQQQQEEQQQKQQQSQHNYNNHRKETIFSSNTTILTTKFSKFLICLLGILIYVFDHSIVECRHHESIENVAATYNNVDVAAAAAALAAAESIEAQPLIGPKHNSQLPSVQNGDDGKFCI